MGRRFAISAAVAAALPLCAAGQAPAALELFTRPDKGHCISCHQLPEGVGSRVRSDLGPKLEGARMREVGKRGIRDVLEDATRANPDTVMPPFGRHRLLDPAEIDRLVEFLHALP